MLSILVGVFLINYTPFFVVRARYMRVLKQRRSPRCMLLCNFVPATSTGTLRAF